MFTCSASGLLESQWASAKFKAGNGCWVHSRDTVNGPNSRNSGEALLVSLGESGLSLELTFRVSPGMTQLQGKHIVFLLPDVRKNVVPSQTLVISCSRSYLPDQG